MRLTKNLLLVELVHPAIYDTWKQSAVSWIHCDAPKQIQQLRDKFGPVTINDWHIGGMYESSGVRLPTGGVGASLSAHKGGFGFDLKFRDVTTDEVLGHILALPDLYPHISRVENLEYTRTSQGRLGRDWLHIEITHNREGDIVVFRP